MQPAGLLLNGRRADLQRLAISTGDAKTATNFWSSLENSATNAWYVNFGSGNFNNNNKNNTYIVRAVAALSERTKESWVEAFEDCCTHKLSSEQCIYYRLSVWRDLMVLAAEVEQRVYVPSTSIRFYVTRPRLREVFAANFRDRIAQHWVCFRIIPLIEQRFHQMGDISYNCRPGFGVLAAINDFADRIKRVSMDYTREAWIIKLDMKAFFMTIDRRILWKLLKPFIQENYHGDDIDTLLWLTWTILRHHPQKDCVLRGHDYKDEMPREKSLLFAELYIGSPIGNITSQILANFILSFMDEVILEYCATHGGEAERFMDDILAVFPTKEAALAFRDTLMAWAPVHLHQQVHPDKVYIQEAHKGVKALGYIIKPGRIYLSNSIIGNLYDTLDATEKLCAEILAPGGTNLKNLRKLEHFVCGINSHFGFLSHAASRNIVAKLFATLPNFWQVCYIKAPHTVKIWSRYQVKTLLNKQEYEYIDLKAQEGGLHLQPFPSEDGHHPHRDNPAGRLHSEGGSADPSRTFPLQRHRRRHYHPSVPGGQDERSAEQLLG